MQRSQRLGPEHSKHPYTPGSPGDVAAMIGSNNAGVIAPPPLLYAAALGVGLAIDFLLYRVQTGLPATVRFGLAILLGVAGIGLNAAAFLQVLKAGTRPEPWRPTTAIVTDGVYASTRNPMYLAMALFYLALAIAADSGVAVIVLVPLLFVVQYGVVMREERYLEAKFGADYMRYKQAVRRWL
jgi:protein-S-isoprenylcysteine O-methyltransferase Ste14